MSILAFLGRLVDGAQEAVDVEADAIIRAFFKRNPEAAYRITKLAMMLALRPEQVKVPSQPPKPRNWFVALLERRDHFAS